MASEGYRISVDIGGTFTDLVILDEESGRIDTLKVSSTPGDPSKAVISALYRARDDFGVDLKAVTHFTHASTIGSNCLLEGQGARTAFVTTDGFQDLLEIQKHKRFDLFDLNYKKIKPLVPRRWVIGAHERIDSSGAVLTEFDEIAFRSSLQSLVGESIEAVAICFLFSFINPDHERRAKEIVASVFPNAFVSCSSDIFPQFREYERASTTVVNACLGPRVGRYLERMGDAVREAGVRVPLYLMQSNGGVISWNEASQMPCRVIESGPAAGVIAAAHFAVNAGRKNVISFDMGGTTAKAGLIENGEVRQASGQEVGAGINVSRLLQGGGYFIGAGTVDLAEVGAGGGSIAWLDGDVLKVGPMSAGADPGPIAYGLGGAKVTVSDANFVLGRVPSDFFLGGGMPLNVEASRRAIREQIAEPLGVSLDEACEAIIDIADANMLKMLRIVSLEKGFDPADFTLVAFGGNGPVHGPDLADELGMSEVLIPPAAGLLSAQGLLVADIRYDFRQTHLTTVTGESLIGVEKLFRTLERQGRDALLKYGLPPSAVKLTRSAEMRYFHQAYEVSVPLPMDSLSPESAPEVIEAFHQAHERRYGRRQENALVEIATLAVAAVGNASHPRYQSLSAGDGSARGARIGSRNVFFRRHGRVDCDHYDRSKLRAKDSISGPAIIVAADCTIVVRPKWMATCDEAGNLLLTKENASDGS